MFKTIIAAIAAIAVAAVSLAASAYAENYAPGGSNNPAEMQDCNCWDDFLEQLQQEQRNESSKSNDAASSLTS
jgi:hypothetical protein